MGVVSALATSYSIFVGSLHLETVNSNNALL